MQEMQKTWVRSLSQEDHLEEEMATHSSVLAWRIPGMGLNRVGHDWSDLAAGVGQLFSKCVFSCSVVSNSFAAPWTIACQPPLSIGFFRQEYCSGLHFLLQEIFTSPGIEPVSHSLAGRFFLLQNHQGSPIVYLSEKCREGYRSVNNLIPRAIPMTLSGTLPFFFLPKAYVL